MTEVTAGIVTDGHITVPYGIAISGQLTALRESVQHNSGVYDLDRWWNLLYSQMNKLRYILEATFVVETRWQKFHQRGKNRRPTVVFTRAFLEWA